MRALPPDRKLYLLNQHRQSRSDTRTKDTETSVPATYGPSSGANAMPRLVPHLTGDSGFMRRLSISGWGITAQPVVSQEEANASHVTDQKRNSFGSTAAEELQPLQPQTTGGLWSGWWSSSGGEKASTVSRASGKEVKTPKWYVESLRGGKAFDSKLIKHLISLRVHLSTANLAWIKEFISDDQEGLATLGDALARLVGKGGKRKRLTDNEEIALLEIVKCFRVLLNTGVCGVQYSLHT